MSSTITIVGGGIGGLANAYALASAGHTVRVLERAAEFAEVGAGLQMAPNATRILRQWGLLDAVLERGVVPRRLVFRDAVDGAELTHLDLGADFVERYGAPYVVIHRSDLLDILVQACRRVGVELLPNTRVDDVVTSADAAVVVSEAGEFTSDLALAADGLRSTLRGKLSDDQPIASGYVAYRGAFPLAEIDVELNQDALQDVVVYLGPGCHLVQYALRSGDMFNTVAVFKSAAYDRGEEDWGNPDELESAFSGMCPDVRRGLRSLWRTRKWPMYDRSPIPTWVDGRLALTGDAAHPMLQYLAQGACQAIEDAYALAVEAGKTVASGGLDWDVALRSYEAVRSERTARVQTSARVWGDIWHVDGVARLLRNELFRDRAADDYKHIDWLYGG
ncbi:FAD-dependent monooxygenase [Micromonospora sp. DR5-3]|uniref:FAD-dependent monooxygenase n=1 Tax=unclassified Micromonospora TaxID=2617518 RepID=UPI0011DB25D1|nr:MULTISPECIES: FAD-dependent monooxygenase [unclassified Micromonospora]MCW3815849.1 FAD-dependent monooxygenase [Micromonospora sp. DR5-3]TYC24366.1 NAD(P)-binding protein [Micromonospora sp. MP36]